MQRASRDVWRVAGALTFAKGLAATALPPVQPHLPPHPCFLPPPHPPTIHLQAFPHASSSSTFAWKILPPQYPAQQSVPPGSLPCTPPPTAQPSVLPLALVPPSDRTDHSPGPPSTLCNTIPTLVSRQQYLLVSPFPTRKPVQNSDRLPPLSKPKHSSVWGTQQARCGAE